MRASTAAWRRRQLARSVQTQVIGIEGVSGRQPNSPTRPQARHQHSRAEASSANGAGDELIARTVPTAAAPVGEQHDACGARRHREVALHGRLRSDRNAGQSDLIADGLGRLFHATRTRWN